MFKPGDIVRCIRNGISQVPEGSTWIVREFVLGEDGTGLLYLEDPPFGYDFPLNPRNFELFPPALIPEDQVRKAFAAPVRWAKLGDALFDETTTYVTDPVTGGRKGTKVCRFDLIPAEALSELAAMYGVGAEKYEPRNWERGYAYTLSFGAMMRHAWRWFRGEEKDPETGIHHMAAVAFHAFALMTFQAREVGTDDRPNH